LQKLSFSPNIEGAVCREFWQTVSIQTHRPINSLMKYTLLAIAVAMLAVSCKSTPAPQPAPPMVDMGVRSGK
jgi:hypothetical protein